MLSVWIREPLRHSVGSDGSEHTEDCVPVSLTPFKLNMAPCRRGREAQDWGAEEGSGNTALSITPGAGPLVWVT